MDARATKKFMFYYRTELGDRSPRYNIVVVVVVIVVVCTNACPGVVREILDLQNVFGKTYHYNTEHWRIPSKSAYNALRKKLDEFYLNEHDGETNLLIVYYGGHGFMDKEGRCMWSWCVIHAFIASSPYPCSHIDLDSHAF